MLAHKAVSAVEQQAWLDAGSDLLMRVVDTATAVGGPASQPIKDALHGTWLGHPLHPALTILPLGAWSTALVFDLLEANANRDDLAAGADTAVALGLVGAAGAALAGLTDWSRTSGPARRLGTLHGLLNTGATLLYALSLASRRRGDRVAGRRLATLGYTAAMTSGYLGGHLVYSQRIGVDHADVEAAPTEFVAVMALSDLPENQPRRVEAQGVPILLVRQQNQLFALAETCSHLGGPLAEGTLDGCSVRCPWHGSRFALDNGRVLEGPATMPQPRFAVRVRAGQIEVRAISAEEKDAQPASVMTTGDGYADQSLQADIHD